MFLPLFRQLERRLSFPSLFLPRSLPVITEVAKIPSVVPRKKRLWSPPGLTLTRLNYFCARSASRARISTFRFPGTTRTVESPQVTWGSQRWNSSYPRASDGDGKSSWRKCPSPYNWDLLSGVLKDCSWIYETESTLLLSYLLMLTPEDFPNTFALSSCADDKRAVWWSLTGHIFKE